LPQPFIERFGKVESALEQMANFFAKQEEAQIASQQEKELDTLLERMHTKAGDFDDEFVLAKMASGQSPEDALKSYNAFLERSAAPKNKPAPSLLGGAGGIPTGQVDPKDMTPAQTREFVARAIAAVNGQ
jgi:hypothetical protein